MLQRAQITIKYQGNKNLRKINAIHIYETNKPFMRLIKLVQRSKTTVSIKGIITINLTKINTIFLI